MPNLAKEVNDVFPQEPEMKQEFETYILWRSLPSILRGLSIEKLQEFGMKDEIVLELLSVKNQVAFAEKYGIGDLGTLTDWNKRIDSDDLLKNSWKWWCKKLTANVMSGFYRKAVAEGDAARIKLWHQIIEDWEEKSEHKITGHIESENLTAMTDEVKKTLSEFEENMRKLLTKPNEKKE